jgi:hypothetical protein
LQIHLTTDELILTLISLIRAVDPRMLQQGPEGFSVDFERIDTKKSPLTGDEALMLKLRAVLERAENAGPLPLELEVAEGKRLAGTLERLEGLQTWPADVLAMSARIRARLGEVT